MRNNLAKTALAASLWLAMVFTIFCDAAGNPSALVGRWIGVSGDDKSVVMELLSDGTGIITRGSEGFAFTWKTESGRFYITASGRAQSRSYKLQGSQLTFTSDKGEMDEYMKCKKDCQEAAKEYAKAKFAKMVKKGSFTDSRDGKSYKTLKFGNQTWMAENLGYNAEGSKCYENSESNCQKYGKLYNWKTALNACPKGWHLPSFEEWETLEDLAGGSYEAGNILKSASGWESNGNGVDAVGFSALPGGYGSSDGNFGSVGKSGDWWSTTEGDAGFANARAMVDYSARVLGGGPDKSNLYSVRCIQD